MDSLASPTMPQATHSRESDDESSQPEDAPADLDGAEKERKELATRESRVLFGLRVFIFALLAFTTCFAIGAVFIITRRNQLATFEIEFESYGSRVIDYFHKTFERQLVAIESLSVQITGEARARGHRFPLVTLPDFEIRGANVRILSALPTIMWLPLVTDDTRAEWEAYVAQHRDRLHSASLVEEFQQQARQDVGYGLSNGEIETFEVDYQPTYKILQNTADGFVPQANGTGPYLPIWQQTSTRPVAKTLNYNALTSPQAASAYRKMLSTGLVVLDKASNLNYDESLSGPSIKSIKSALSVSQYRHVVNDVVKDPTSSLVFPVFSDFGENRTVVGAIGTRIFWNFLFQDQLPEEARGIICVVTNTRNQTFTYRIDGQKATYVGEGDRHQAKFDELGVFADVARYLRSRSSPLTRSYTSVDLDEEYCAYSLQVYPSQETQDKFVNSEATRNAIVVACIFIFVSFFLAAYDCLVSRRQRLVLNRALASGAIVSSLFPETVRKQLYNDSSPSKHKIESPWTAEEQHEKSIAEVYDATTILFGDLVGFTKWSNSRTPCEVFELLGRVFGEFDKLADRLGVFKVETVGDCIVCATGVPFAQPKHAIIMARFAQECQEKLHVLLDAAAVTLGEDTAGLSMRIGLHTGSVVGGVLAGQKKRFQLYGDTMNYAARMESTGMQGQIHVSQETAQALEQGGKGHWVTKREDKVYAKGLGELQTYWVSVVGRAGSSATTLSDMDAQSSRIVNETNL